MCPVVVIVTNVLGHETLEMPFVEYDDVIKQVPAATANKAFRDSVLPRASEAGPLGLNAEALYGANDCLAEICGAVEDQITRSRIVRGCKPETARILKSLQINALPCSHRTSS